MKIKALTGICMAALLLSGCATTGAKRTIGSLAGSTVGAAAGRVVGATGVLGYATSMATVVLGNVAGQKVMSLFGRKTQRMQQGALIQALDAPGVGTAITWGETGQAPKGYAASTGPAFTPATGGQCRAFRLVTAKQKGMISNKLVQGVQNARSAVNSGQNAADTVGNADNVGDAVSGARQVASTATNAADAAKALTADAPIIDPAVAAMPIDQEMFGTACKDKKGAWAIVKT
jgi:surface antigen